MRPELWGVIEIAEALDVSRATVYTWIEDGEGFPEPLAQLRSGRVWSATEVRSWRRRQIKQRRERMVF